MNEVMTTQCRICSSQTADFADGALPGAVTCPRCGTWMPLPGPGVPTPLNVQLAGGRANHRSARLSHIVQRGQSGGVFGVRLDLIPSYDLDAALPNPIEQIDNLIQWIAAQQLSYAQSCEIPIPAVSAWIGAPITSSPPDAGAISWLLNQAPAQRFIKLDNRHDGKLAGRLTMDGWQRVEELKQKSVDSRLAFMALQFGDPDLDAAVSTCFKPAVAKAGFELRMLTDKQPAGLIDDQLRVAIRRARLVVCDLTHGNKGAYWEGGFAEGIGRPVIYTCRQAEWAMQKTHFDTNHLVTVIWSPDNLANAATRLTETIRATLPLEATLED